MNQNTKAVIAQHILNSKWTTQEVIDNMGIPGIDIITEDGVLVDLFKNRNHLIHLHNTSLEDK